MYHQVGVGPDGDYAMIVHFLPRFGRNRLRSDNDGAIVYFCRVVNVRNAANLAIVNAMPLYAIKGIVPP